MSKRKVISSRNYYRDNYDFRNLYSSKIALALAWILVGCLIALAIGIH